MDNDFVIYDFYDQMRKHQTLLAFQGVVSQDLLSRLASSLKRKSSQEDPNIGRKIFAIFIELSQNVSLHSIEKSYSIKEDKPIGVGYLLVSEADDHFLISSSNLIENSILDHVMERCQYINSLDDDELKDYYKEQRRAPQRPDKPGANIGLIDMVRKSNNPLIGEAYPHPDYPSQSFLTITVRLDK
jgi:hypothetical protein